VQQVLVERAFSRLHPTTDIASFARPVNTSIISDEGAGVARDGRLKDPPTLEQGGIRAARAKYRLLKALGPRPVAVGAG
jgi:hypothetical protein